MLNFCGGVMFHHFHDEKKHITSQGSIDAEHFYDLLIYLKKNGYILLNPDEYSHKIQHDDLNEEEICVTFDDGLKCQFDVACPVLDSMGVQAFWFVYTSPLRGSLEKLEIYRHFRFSRFDDVEDFYRVFFGKVEKNENSLEIDFAKSVEDFLRSGFAREFAFYTDSDRKYRYFRDIVLGAEKYFHIVDQMILDFDYDAESHRDILWLSEDDIRRLHVSGHRIGLHSHTHPTNIRGLSFDKQLAEYRENSEIIKSITKVAPNAVSYPCGSFNDDTGLIMNSLGVQLGFDAKPADSWSDKTHIPREDHANILRLMRKEGA
jgi:peptidoglycan/xylan/chitin deacetylase (PgdA/CDA1 family)